MLDSKLIFVVGRHFQALRLSHTLPLRYTLYHKGFPSGRLSEAPEGWPAGSPPPRLLIMTVATHREPFIDLVEHSVEQLGSEFLLHVVGVGGVFTG